MANSNHTHELRHHDYRKNTPDSIHIDVINKGTEDECYKALQDKVDLDNKTLGTHFGIGLYLNNVGYSVASLEKERKESLRDAAPQMLEVLQMLINHSVITVADGDYHSMVLNILKKFN